MNEFEIIANDFLYSSWSVILGFCNDISDIFNAATSITFDTDDVQIQILLLLLIWLCVNIVLIIIAWSVYGTGMCTKIDKKDLQEQFPLQNNLERQ